MNRPHSQKHAQAVATWERLFKQGKLDFKPCTAAELPESTMAYVGQFLDSAGLHYELCSMVIDGQYLLRVHDEVVGFLAHCSVCEEHVFGAPDFGDLDNNSALARLAVLAGLVRPDEEQTAHQVFDFLDRLRD